MKIFISVLLALTISIATVIGVPLDKKDGKNVNYTPEEQIALKNFRDRMGPLPQPYMNSDNFLINWIRGSDSGGGYKIIRNSTYSKYVFAPGFDLDDAAKKLQKSLAWRKENKIDEILSEDFSDMKKMYPYDISRRDRNGRPVLVAEYAEWDFKKALDSSPADRARFFRYIDYILESMAAKTRSHQTIDYIYLIDAAGFNLDTHACPKCKDFYKYYSQQSEAHYPEMIKNLFNVNAPKEYDTVGKIWAENLSPNTVKRVNNLDNNKDKWLKVVEQVIPRDQIPKHYIEGTPAMKKEPIEKKHPLMTACAGCKVSG